MRVREREREYESESDNERQREREREAERGREAERKLTSFLRIISIHIELPKITISVNVIAHHVI